MGAAPHYAVKRSKSCRQQSEKSYDEAALAAQPTRLHFHHTRPPIEAFRHVIDRLEYGLHLSEI